jgi:hypothetical protein
MIDFDANKKEDCRKWLDAEPDNYDSTEWYNDENAMAFAWATRMTTPCTWTEDTDGVYHSACGHAFEYLHHGPNENGAKWCCYCGGPIQEKPYKAEEEKEKR